MEKHEHYLGLPTMVGRTEKVIFGQIKERIWKKMKGWKANYLSRAGKEVLIKSVIQSIPMYAMSCFKLPTTFCRELEQLMSRFL